ncbi:hypothetical protein P9265_22400 [Schinkia azotoformans]|uniref:hypothetical protein n=1 Tax=Schinkia azotoformans TaxID=1454 RepID=UPI002E1BB526|nr:hypothetical protein [Schinkia azotoformans]
MRKSFFVRFTKIAVITLILVLFIILLTDQNTMQRNINANSKPLNTNTETSLMEAYQIAFSVAKDWNKNAVLVSLTSVDDSNNRVKAAQGIQGKRKTWNIDFANPNSNSNEHLFVTISEGVVKNKIQTKGPNIQEKFIHSFNINSPEVVDSAIKDFNLLPGKEWAVGYHFKLEKIDNKTLITVVGLDPKNNFFTEINYDAVTGKLINVEQKVSTGGGLYSSNSSNINIIDEENSAVIGLIISPDDSKVISWGYREVYTPNEKLFLKVSDINMEHWKEIKYSNLTSIKNIWFSQNYKSDKKIYIFDGKKIYVTKNMKGPLEEVYSIENEENISVVRGTSIGILTSNTIYLSKDGGESWENIDTHDNITSFDISSNGLIVTLLGDKVFKQSVNGWEQIEVPFAGINGIKLIDDFLVAYNQENLQIYDLNNENWLPLNIRDGVQIIINDRTSIHNLFVLNLKGELYKLDVNDKFKLTKLHYPGKGVLVGITSNHINNNIIFTMAPTQEWVELINDREREEL